MEEMTVRVPVAIKSKVTEGLKAKLIADLQQRLDLVEQDLQQIEFQAKRLLSEQAKSMRKVLFNYVSRLKKKSKNV